FTVNGVQMIDPGNPAIKPQRSPRTSILHIPATPPQPWDYQEVPHGTVHQHTYSSKTLERSREFFVYTPPGYERSGDKKYPVLYLVHGSGDNHAAWSGHGKAHWILDNLIAQGKAQPMIVVMPDGHPIAPGTGSREEYGRANSEAFEKELTGEILPLVEATYRVRSDAQGRALAGLSMGGGHTLHTGLRHLDAFAWLGAFSAGIPSGDRIASAISQPESVNQKLKLFWIACGKKDFLIPRNRELHDKLTEKGVRHTWLETEGDHSWPVWRNYLTEFAPLLFKDTAS
ncbi:MAG: esterase family protein, partial [Verrucomicrobiaceae bacterium]